MRSMIARPVAMIVALLTTNSVAFADETVPAALPSPACIAAFDRQVQPILNLRCVQCHQTAGPDGGLALQGGGTAERIVAIASHGSPLNLIEPGRPEVSYLLMKIMGRQLEVGGTGARMPLIGAMLSDGNIATIRAWIEGCTLASQD